VDPLCSLLGLACVRNSTYGVIDQPFSPSFLTFTRFSGP
jgi:hypothetical protein